jgi:hypothetical protein
MEVSKVKRIMITLTSIFITFPAMSATPLHVLFANPEPELCRFFYVPSLVPVFEAPYQDPVTGEIVPGVWVIRFGAKSSMTALRNREVEIVNSMDAANTRLLEFMIKIGGLDLTPSDFRDVSTGEYECTNDKLFSLLALSPVAISSVRSRCEVVDCE